MTKLDRLLRTAAHYDAADIAVPLDLETAVAVEGGSLTPITEDHDDNG